MIRLFPKLIAARGGLWNMAAVLRRSSAQTRLVTGARWFLRLFGTAARRGPLGLLGRQPEGRVHLLAHALQSASDCISITRSEERRVGKECRSWWSPYQ